MRLKFDFELIELDNRLIAVPVGDHASIFHGVLSMNETSSFILKLLRYDVSEENIIDSLVSEYGVSREIASTDVRLYLMKLREKDLLIVD